MKNVIQIKGIGQAIEDYLIASRIREEDPNKVRKFYVSDMGKCHRMRFLKRKGVSSEFDKHVYWTFAMGDMIHEFGYKALEAQGLLVDTEEVLDCGEHFVGRYDAKTLAEGTDPEITDFKSANPWKLKKLESGGDDGEGDAMQIMTYVKFHKIRHPDKPISNRGRVVYINKEPSEKTTLTLIVEKTFTLSLWEKKIDEDMNKMIKYWMTGTIPPCTCPAWMKPYNNFLPLCEAKEESVQKIVDKIDQKKKILVDKSGVYEISVKKDVVTRKAVKV